MDDSPRPGSYFFLKGRESALFENEQTASVKPPKFALFADFGDHYEDSFFDHFFEPKKTYFLGPSRNTGWRG